MFTTCVSSELDSRRVVRVGGIRIGCGHRGAGQSTHSFGRSRSRISRCRSRRWLGWCQRSCCRTAVVAGQLRSLWVTRCVKVGVPFRIRETRQLLPADGGERQARIAAQLCQGLQVFRRVDRAFREGHTPGFQHAPCRIAGRAVLAGVQSDRKTRCHFAQFKRQTCARSRGATGRTC